MSESVSYIGNCEVLWIGCYPAHYTRVMHCEIERLRPGVVHFFYVVEVEDQIQRSYERGGMPESSELVGRFPQWLPFLISLVKSKPKLVILAGYGDRFTKCALVWVYLTRRRFYFWSDTNLLDVLDRSRLNRFLRKSLLKTIFSRATRLLHIGSRNRDYWIWLLGRQRAQEKLYHMAYPALLMPDDGSGVRESRQTAEKFTILFLGRLEPVKAVDKLLKAVSQIGLELRRSLRLDICGTGSEKNNLEILVRKLGLTEIVVFYGAVPSDQVAQAYSRADLFVLPSDLEPWGLVINEALSAGVPVMCPFWIGAAADLVVDGVTGYVLDDNEPGTIAAGIERAWRNREATVRLGQRGRELVRNGPWNNETVTKRFLQLVDTAVEKPAKEQFRQQKSTNPQMKASSLDGYKSFYDERRSLTYGHDYENFRAEDHSFYPFLQEFIAKYELKSKRCLEIGSSGGFFQDLVVDYWGTDIADSLARYYHKPYRIASGGHYPFDDAMFDAIWTITVHEHIPDLQASLLEIQRLLKPGGVICFAPAWQCRSWAGEGYAVRPYRDLGWKGKLIKMSILIRERVWFRSMFIFPKRAYRQLQYLLGKRFDVIRYKKLKPNYEVFWTSDSDACNAIDPHDAILWFLSHEFECLSHQSFWKVFFVRTGALVFRKNCEALIENI
jgi:glycosyltransferase involved in cell wall biosynthesis/SAM-dependent methyltransferase